MYYFYKINCVVTQKLIWIISFYCYHVSPMKEKQTVAEPRKHFWLGLQR